MNTRSRFDPVRLPSSLKKKAYCKNVVEDADSDLEQEKEDEDEEEEEEEVGELGFEGHVKKIKANLDGGYGGRGSSAGGGTGVSPPFCRVEECDADLTGAKQYYRRHRVCEVHAKLPVVVVAGVRRRFCQQCSRFHELSEFDEAKRSCRRRLAGHNERRRKNSSESHRARSRQTDA